MKNIDMVGGNHICSDGVFTTPCSKLSDLLENNSWEQQKSEKSWRHHPYGTPLGASHNLKKRLEKRRLDSGYSSCSPAASLFDSMCSVVQPPTKCIRFATSPVPINFTSEEEKESSIQKSSDSIFKSLQSYSPVSDASENSPNLIPSIERENFLPPTRDVPEIFDIIWSENPTRGNDTVNAKSNEIDDYSDIMKVLSKCCESETLMWRKSIERFADTSLNLYSRVFNK